MTDATTTTTTTGYSQQDPDDSASEYRSRQFQIERTISRVRTIIPVKVIAVNGGGGAVAAPPTVNVQPLVKVIDGQGNVTSHGTINNVPVWRLQSAWGSLIVDPVVGDVGAMGVCDRDISVVKSTSGQESQPGSRRKYDFADGIYFGGLFGAVPTQYVRFTEHGVEIISGTDGINLNGLKINQQGQVDGNLPVTGALELAGSIEALAGGEYAGNIVTSGTISGSDMIANPGAAQVTLRGHISTAANVPPTPGH